MQCFPQKAVNSSACISKVVWLILPPSLPKSTAPEQYTHFKFSKIFQKEEFSMQTTLKLSDLLLQFCRTVGFERSLIIKSQQEYN